MARKHIMTEREVWHLIHDDSEACTRVRERATKDFVEMCPHGHRESLRGFVSMIPELIEDEIQLPKKYRRLMRQFHPAALTLLLDFGVDYRPLSWEHQHPETWEDQPQPHSCSLNSANFMRVLNFKSDSLKYVYVEGLIVSALSPPMLHAWNTREVHGCVAVDWTHYSIARWTRYFGIPLTQDEHEKAAELCNYSGRAPLLLDKKHFPMVESYLKETLANRQAA